MSDDDDRRRRIRSRLFGSVAEIADLDYQRATWLDPEMQNPHFTFVEFIECFYDVTAGSYDSDDPGSKDAPLSYLVSDELITVAERDAIWPLHLALKDYEEPSSAYNLEGILSDRKWQGVCRIASQAQADLLTMVGDHERAFFENVLPSASGKRWP